MAISLETAALRVTVDTDRGGQIVWVGQPGGPNVLFHEPWDAPRPASRRTGYGSPTLDWLSHYRGGWQVMFPNAGAECVLDGLTHPVHGEVSAMPAEVIELAADHLVLRSTTRQALSLVRTFSLSRDRPCLTVEERVTNDSELPNRYAWGQHPAFVASPTTRIDLPAGMVEVDGAFDVAEADLESGARGQWPTIPDRAGRPVDLSHVPAGPVERVCYLPDRPDGWAALRDPATGAGVALAWDTGAFPHLWLWEQVGGQRFPFHGRARIVALEPVSCWPGDGLAAAVERGQARTIDPGVTASSWIILSIFRAGESPATGVDRTGRVELGGAA